MEDRKELMQVIKQGVENGALVLGAECEIIAFDSEGRLAYPIKQEG